MVRLKGGHSGGNCHDAAQMATRGSEVAAGLAQRLGLAIVHHEIVEHDIAEHAGLPESEVHRYLEGEASLMERWRLDRKRMSRYTAQEILELAANGNALIRGWGATYLLRIVPHVLVRNPRPMPFRSLDERLGIQDASAARREIEHNDAAHNGTMQRLFWHRLGGPVTIRDRAQHGAGSRLDMRR